MPTVPPATRRAMLGAVPLGAMMMGALAQKAAAAEMTAAEKANIDTVTAFLNAFKPKDMTTALTYMAPESVYRMTERTPAAKGYEAITARLRDLVDGAEKIRFDIYASYAAGPIVINHRLDTFTSTTHPLLFEGVGVFFLKDGKIVEWTDYTIRAALANQWPAAKA